MTESSAQLEREAERRRAELSATLDELRSRITPGQLVDQTLDYARDGNIGEFVRNLGRDARDNPLPLALIGAGIAWLMIANGRRPAPVPGDAMLRPGGTVSELADQASDRVSTAYHDAAEAAAGMAHRVSENTSAAGRGLLGYIREEPLLLAGLGIALGAALSAVLPSTRAESRATGQTSDEAYAGIVAQSAHPEPGHAAERQGLDGMYPVAQAAESSVVPATPGEPAGH